MRRRPSAGRVDRDVHVADDLALECPEQRHLGGGKRRAAVRAAQAEVLRPVERVDAGAGVRPARGVVDEQQPPARVACDHVIGEVLEHRGEEPALVLEVALQPAARR